jgi:hypothetical protein
MGIFWILVPCMNKEETMSMRYFQEDLILMAFFTSLAFPPKILSQASESGYVS